MIIAIDPGARFGMLAVLRETGSQTTPNGTRKRLVLCRCDCGTEKVVNLYELTRRDAKRTVSCGCYRDRENRLRLPPPPVVVHGLTSRTKNHYLYNTWKSIKNRCFRKNDANYYAYGGRGITMCAEWRDNPAAFVEYVLREIGERPPLHTLDRTNNDGHYEPGNLRWATKSEQIHNRRPTSEWRRWWRAA